MSDVEFDQEVDINCYIGFKQSFKNKSRRKRKESQAFLKIDHDGCVRKVKRFLKIIQEYDPQLEIDPEISEEDQEEKDNLMIP